MTDPEGAGTVTVRVPCCAGCRAVHHVTRDDDGLMICGDCGCTEFANVPVTLGAAAVRDVVAGVVEARARENQYGLVAVGDDHFLVGTILAALCPPEAPEK